MSGLPSASAEERIASEATDGSEADQLRNRKDRPRNWGRRACKVPTTFSWPRFQHHIERTLGGATDPTEATFLQPLGWAWLSGLSAECFADFLGHRGRHADHRRCIIVETADRIADVVGRIIRGNRLDDHPGTPVVKQTPHTRGAPP